MNGDPFFYIRHYLNLFGSGCGVIVALVWRVWWIAPVFAVCFAWSVMKLRRGPAT
jgi:hypothetical protein